MKITNKAKTIATIKRTTAGLVAIAFLFLCITIFFNHLQS